MNKKIGIALTFLFSICQVANAQKNMSSHDILAEVKVLETISTGKAHNSFFFLFKIEKLLLGDIMDSLIFSQEIYADFGGKQMREKLSSGDRIALKFKLSETSEANEYLRGKTNVKTVNIKWASEVTRIESFHRLEEKLPEGDETQNTRVEFLQEEKGRLFYRESGIQKIAVEIIPGYWITATVDK